MAAPIQSLPQLPDLATLSDKDLEKLALRVTSVLEGRKYFQELESEDEEEDGEGEAEAYSELPDNAKQLVAQGVIKLVKYQDDPNAWFCYEHGHAWKASFKVKGLKKLVHLHKIQHNSKHTFTETRKITIGKETYIYSNGDHAIEEDYNVKVLVKLHQLLQIPKSQTAQMVHFLFLRDSWFPYIEDRIEPLGDEDEEDNEDEVSELSDLSQSEDESASDSESGGKD